MGSSTLMMCSCLVLLILSIIAASEVDLPLPVGPVTRTSPRGFSVRSCNGLRQPELLMLLISLGTVRKAAPRRTLLEVDVDPEAGAVGQRVAEVELPLVLQALALVVGEDVVDHVARRVGRQGGIIQRLDLAADPHHGRQARRNVQVARPQCLRSRVGSRPGRSRSSLSSGVHHEISGNVSCFISGIIDAVYNVFSASSMVVMPLAAFSRAVVPQAHHSPGSRRRG